jgi:uncharacterized membrane protein
MKLKGIVSLILVAAAGCSPPDPGGTASGEAAQRPSGVQPLDDEKDDATAYSGIGASETVRFTGTEPFWAGQVVGSALTYSTPEEPDGTDIAVTRFAGRGGVSWTGRYAGGRFTLAVTPGRCSDGMSDRAYPFVATLEVAGQQRTGCAWTDRSPANETGR